MTNKTTSCPHCSPDTEELTRLNVEIPEKLHRRLKVAAAINGLKVRDVVIKGIEQQLEKLES